MRPLHSAASRALLVALAIVLLTPGRATFSNDAVSNADVSSADVGNNLASLEGWLGTSVNGKAWTSYLKLTQLRAELAKGPAADLNVLADIQKQFESGAAGLELAPFQAVRKALGKWSQELSAARVTDLPQAVLRAQAEFHRVKPEEIAAARKSLDAAIAQLDRYLKSAGTNGANWRTYLKWDDLQTQLKASAPDSDALLAVRQRYTADFGGLELPVFANVSAALEGYANTLAASRDAVEAEYSSQLTTLADRLKDYLGSYSDETAQAVGGQLGWLENMRQAPALLRAVRSRYSAPNLHAQVSARLVGAGIQQPVDDVTSVSDVILGTSIRGTGRTTGRIEVGLIPSSDKAIIETRLVGTTVTRTVGQNGPATIQASGTTQIAGKKQIVLDASGLASAPATATANTRTQILGVSAGGRIAQNVANNRVYESKAQAEQIASQHAAARVRGRVDEQARGQLAQANGKYLNEFRNPLVRRGEFPSLLQFRTTSDNLLVTGLQANRFQMGAPTPAPPITVAADLAVQIHESMVNNFAAALLSGLTLKEEELQQKVIELRGSLPEQLKSDPDRDPWSMTFAKSRPVTLRLTDGGFEVTLRGQRYTSGSSVYPAMNVTAIYKTEMSGHGSKAVRQGDLTILPPNFNEETDRLSGQQLALRRLLTTKFGKLFEPEIKSDGLVLPGRWREAGRLDLKQMTSGNGWLAMAWIESGEPAPPEDKVAIDPRR